MRDYRLIAPVRLNDELRFDVVVSADQVVLDYTNTTKAPKSVVFPQMEQMLRFGQKLDHYNEIIAMPMDTTPTILLGVRPCDARSFLLLDRVFMSAQYVDPYYQARRQNTLVFSLACDRPRQTCFCHAFGSGPYDTEGADVILKPAGDAYLVDALNERGAQALAAYPMPSADDVDRAPAQRLQEQAQARLAPIEPVAGIEKALSSLFDSPVWQEIAAKCLACGTCTYNCPTCHCFNIEDRALASGGERVRAWDACMYAAFTAHASGHNPRPDQAARWRQRTMHKFNYLPQNVGLYGCVGCGRCVRSCPVRLDIRAVLARVRQEQEAKVKA